MGPLMRPGVRPEGKIHPVRIAQSEIGRLGAIRLRQG